jgi:hypothetical protein
MNSSTNRDELAKASGKYLLATLMASVSEIKEKVLTNPGRFRTIAENLQAKEVVVAMGSSNAGISCTTIPARLKESESIGSRLSKSLKRKSKIIRISRRLPDGPLIFSPPAGTNDTLQSISWAESDFPVRLSIKRQNTLANGCYRPTMILSP